MMNIFNAKLLIATSTIINKQQLNKSRDQNKHMNHEVLQEVQNIQPG